MMVQKFHEYDYDLYLVFINSEKFRILDWSNWEKIVSIFKPIIEVLPDKTALRSSQYNKTRKGKNIPFGRLSWDEKSHVKWTHNSPVSSDLSMSWDFIGVELWSPSWTESEKRGRAPRFYISIAKMIPNFLPENCDTLFVCAISRDMEAEQLSETKNVVSRFVKLSGSKLAVYRARQWGVSSVAGGFTDSIQDIGYSGLYKDGPIDRSKLSKDLLKDSEKWSVIL